MSNDSSVLTGQRYKLYARYNFRVRLQGYFSNHVILFCFKQGGVRLLKAWPHNLQVTRWSSLYDLFTVGIQIWRAGFLVASFTTSEVFGAKQQTEMGTRHDVGYCSWSFHVRVMVYDLLHVWGQATTGLFVVVHYRRVGKMYVTKCWH
jgi:hypothetical protein